MRKLVFSILFAFTIFSPLLAQEVYFYEDNSMKRVDEVIENPQCQKIDSIVDFVLTKVGKRYKYGSTGPNAFDCSGLMYFTFKNFGIELLRSSRDQYKMGKPVKRNEIRKGDLVFFTRGKTIGHVGLVTEVDSNHNFKFVHASTQNVGVIHSDSRTNGYAARYVGARRIIDCDDMEVPYIVTNNLLAMHGEGSGSMESAVVDSQDKTPSISQPSVVYHKVKKGETLSSISKKHKVSVANLKKWNKLKSDMIKIDQRLKIYK